MSRPIPCHGPRFRLTGKPAIALKNHAFQSQPPLRMLGREPNAQGHVFRPAPSTRKDQCCPSFAGLPGFYFATAPPIGCYHLTNGLPIQLVRGLG
jgi:hypothetical protein